MLVSQVSLESWSRQAVSWPCRGLGGQLISGLRVLFGIGCSAHTAVFATLQPFPSFRPETTVNRPQPFQSVGMPQVFPKCSWRMCEEEGRGRRNRCDEKSTQDVVAVRMLDF